MNTDKNILVTTSEELAEAVQSAPRVLAVGAGTKPRLSAVASDVVKISTVKLSGIVEYEPSEFTFTALAGTPVKEIAASTRTGPATVSAFVTTHDPSSP